MAKDIVTKAEILGGEIDVRANFGQTVKVTVSPDPYMGDTEVTPSAETQVLATKKKFVQDDITVYPAPTETLSTTENGTFTPSDGNVGFSQVDVDVPNRGYDIPKIDDGNAHIWVDVLDQFRDMKVYCFLRGETVVSVDWGDGTEVETYYGKYNVDTMNHGYEKADFYHIVLKTVKEPQQSYQKAFGGTGNLWLLGGGDTPARFYQTCLVGFESGNWHIRGGQFLWGSSCYAAYYKHATGATYGNYLSNCKTRHYELPDIVTSLASNFFESDTCVGDFIIPERIVTMGSSVFANTGYIKIHMESAVPPTLSGSFGSKCYPTIYVPVGSLEAYKTAPNWSNYADSIFEEPTA